MMDAMDDTQLSKSRAFVSAVEMWCEDEQTVELLQRMVLAQSQSKPQSHSQCDTEYVETKKHLRSEDILWHLQAVAAALGMKRMALDDFKRLEFMFPSACVACALACQNHRRAGEWKSVSVKHLLTYTFVSSFCLGDAENRSLDSIFSFVWGIKDRELLEAHVSNFVSVLREFGETDA